MNPRVRRTSECGFSGKENPMSDYELITIFVMVLGLVIAAGDN